MDTVFTLFLAGCAHGAVTCEELERAEIMAESMAQCERILDRRLARETAEYPEILGLCVPGDGTAVAQIPAWWPLS